MVTYKCEKIQSALMHLLFGLCAIAFGCVIISPNFSVKVLSVAGVTALLVFILDLRILERMMCFGYALYFLLLAYLT